MFTDISEQVIKESQIQAKWDTDMERRYLANFALDMYNGLYYDYLNKKIDDTVSAQGDLTELKKYIDTLNILKTIINDTSLVFAEKPDIAVMVGDKINDPATEALNKILQEADWFVILNELNRYTNLFYDMVAVPVTRDGKIEIDLITPDRAFIYNSDFDPTTSETTFYLISELPNDQRRAARSDLYMACNKEGKKLVEVKGKDKFGKPIVIDYAGKAYDDFIDDTKYPCNPAVTFRNYFPLSSYWHPGLNPLVEADLNTDMRLTEYNMARAYQLPLLATFGLENSADITKGQKARLNFPPVMGTAKTDAKYLTPDQKLTELGEQIYHQVENIKLSHKLSKSTITGQTATSGYELMLSKAEILNWNKSQQKYYVRPMQQLCECIMALANRYGINTFPADAKIEITFGEQQFIETPKERVERQQKELAAGVKNLIDVEVENSDGVLDRLEAMKMVTERKEENKKLNALAVPEFPGANIDNEGE